MKRGLIIMIGFATAAIVAAGVVTARARAHGATVARDASARAPVGVRIRVQVLNGTTTRGLARRATMVLRDHGFDVVDMGTATAGQDTTIVLDLSGHPDWARRVARAVAPARITVRPDSSRYLDIAVVLGSTWRPPAEPLDP
jgi:hypothetical protein